MGIINYFREKRDNKRLERLKKDLSMIGNEIYFDPSCIANKYTLKDRIKSFSNRTYENYIWFTGDANKIRTYYVNCCNKNIQDLNLFWKTAPDDYRKIHSGIPTLISSKKATILFGGGFDINVEVYQVDENGNVTNTINETASQQAKEIILGFIEKIKYNSILQEAAITESWSGHVFFKYSFDTNLSDFPILEVVDLRNAEVIKDRGITKAIIFKNYYEVENDDKGCKKYRLDEIYTTTEDGDACIIHRLYKLKSDSEIEQVSLEKFPFTNELINNPNIIIDGLDAVFVFNGIKGILASDKPNKLPCYDGTVYGRSDYDGSIPSFDALDETISEIFREVRDNKTQVFFPKTMTPIDENGKALKPNPYKRAYQRVGVTEGTSLEREEKPYAFELNDKTLSHIEKRNVILTTIINNAGLSPTALGIPGFESINASAESQVERNKATLETRSESLKLWSSQIKADIMKALELFYWMGQNTDADQTGFDTVDIDFSNTNITVSFPDYITNTQEEKIAAWSIAKQNGMVSIETIIDILYPEWSSSQKEAEINRIKFENNISFDTPDTLQFSDYLRGTTDDTENNIES